MKKTILFSVAALSALTLGAAAAKHASADPVPTGQVPLYRTYNPNSGEHFYTTSYSEATNAYDAGWNIEGVGWETPGSGAPVYRLFNPNSHDAGSHYYTGSAYEAKHLADLGWKWENNEQPVFYSGGQYPIYVQYNKNNSGHNYTTSSYEAQQVINAGWEQNNVTISGVGEGNKDGAKIHDGSGNDTSPGVFNPVNPSTSAPHQVDVGASDVQPSGSYRLLYPDNAFPKGDLAAIPSGSPTVSITGNLKVSQDGNDKERVYIGGSTGADGNVNMMLQNLGASQPGLTQTEFGAHAVSLVIGNYKAGNTVPGGQYYVTVLAGVNQTSNNTFEIDYYAGSDVAVYKMNGNVVAVLHTHLVKQTAPGSAYVVSVDGNGTQEFRNRS